MRLPIAGRVSMDSMTLDVSAVPEGTLRLRAVVELIGPHLSVGVAAAQSSTITYEMLTALVQGSLGSTRARTSHGLL